MADVSALRDDLEEALAAVSRAGDWMTEHRGLDDTGFEAYLEASSAIRVLLAHLPEPLRTD